MSASAFSFKHNNTVQVKTVSPYYSLTPKQLDDFNTKYGHLQGEMYLLQLHRYERMFGFREAISAYN